MAVLRKVLLKSAFFVENNAFFVCCFFELIVKSSSPKKARTALISMEDRKDVDGSRRKAVRNLTEGQWRAGRRSMIERSNSDRNPLYRVVS